MPVGAAQPGSVGSFGRNPRFRHFNKLTVRDFADAKRNGPAVTDARIPSRGDAASDAPEPKC
jgi:hypothetical protein